MPLHPVDVHVGKRLRQRRTMLGLSQEALGDAVGITFQQVQKYEKGTNRISASRLYGFARILGVRVLYFFEGMEGYSSIDESPENTLVTTDEKINRRETLEMMRAYHQIRNLGVRKNISDFIKAIAAQETPEVLPEIEAEE
jgi:transcriptional regulator with XRE-family HTH domain